MRQLVPFLIVFIGLGIFLTQAVFLIWLYRRLKKSYEPISPETNRVVNFAFAGMLFAVSLGFASYTIFLLAAGNKTTGTITEIRGSHDKDGDEIFSPTFQFIDQNGATNTIRSSSSQSPNPYQIGDQVPVMYRASKPSSARVDSFMDNWGVALVTFALGTFLLLLNLLQRKWREWRGLNKANL